MPRRYFLPALALTVFAGLPALAQTALKDPQAVVLTSQAVQTLTGGQDIADVLLRASVAYVAGSDEETGTATLEASGSSESKMVLSLSGGQRQEVRNGQAGDWVGPDGQTHSTALHNCWVDGSWFFPAFLLAAVSNDPQVSAAYIGQETWEGLNVHHLRLSRIAPNQEPSVVAVFQKLSATDIYLDAVSLLPLVLRFNTHADDDANLDIPVEIRYFDYKPVNGVDVPFRIQKHLQGSLMVAIFVDSSVTNSGLPQSDFALPTM